MKNTPGPWYIDPIKSHANGNRRIMAEQCTPVAVVPEHLAADARLIAAAPDLLDVLYIALPYIEDAELDPSYKPGVVAVVTAQIREAIAKATGEEV